MTLKGLSRGQIMDVPKKNETRTLAEEKEQIPKKEFDTLHTRGISFQREDVVSGSKTTAPNTSNHPGLSFVPSTAWSGRSNG